MPVDRGEDHWSLEAAPAHLSPVEDQLGLPGAGLRRGGPRIQTVATKASQMSGVVTDFHWEWTPTHSSGLKGPGPATQEWEPLARGARHGRVVEGWTQSGLPS